MADFAQECDGLEDNTFINSPKPEAFKASGFLFFNMYKSLKQTYYYGLNAKIQCKYALLVGNYSSIYLFPLQNAYDIL